MYIYIYIYFIYIYMYVYIYNIYIYYNFQMFCPNCYSIHIAKKTFVISYLDETKLICWSTGPPDPILSKNQKNHVTKFWPTGFF